MKIHLADEHNQIFQLKIIQMMANHLMEQNNQQEDNHTIHTQMIEPVAINVLRKFTLEIHQLMHSYKM